jgi:hypothetical protein
LDLPLFKIAVSNNFAYVIENITNGLKIIDVSDPANPSLSGSLGIGSYLQDVAILNNYAYLIDQDNGDLKVIDVSDPANPFLSGSLAIGPVPVKIAISNKYVFVIDTHIEDLKVIDVSNPSNPQLITNLGLGGAYPYSIALSTNYAYIGDYDADDLKVIQLSCPFNVAFSSTSNGFFRVPPVQPHWDKSGNDIYTNVSGNVGIGTTNPSQKLHIDGNILQTSGDYLATAQVKAINSSGLKLYDDAGAGILVEDGGHIIVSNSRRIEADEIRARDSGGLKLYDDDGKGILVEDGGNVGIGSTNPSAALHIEDSGDVKFILEADNDNSGENDNPRLELRQDGSAIIGALGFIGSDGEIYTNSLSNSLYLMNEDNYSLHLGTNGNIVATISNTGGVGINTTSPTANLTVLGTANKPGGGDWMIYSDHRSKENIVDYQRGMKELLQLRPVSYNYRPEFGWGNQTYVGLVAQEVEKVVPTMVSKIDVNDIQDFRQIDPNEINYMLINALKEQQKMIELLEERVEELERLE